MLFAIRFAAFTDTRVDDELQRSYTRDESQRIFTRDESQRSFTRFDEELLSFRTQGIGADQCALSF
jgi:hypothetical protein